MCESVAHRNRSVSAPQLTNLVFKMNAGLDTVTVRCGTALLQYGAALLQYGTDLLQYGTDLLQYGTALLQYGTALLQYGTANSVRLTIFHLQRQINSWSEFNSSTVRKAMVSSFGNSGSNGQQDNELADWFVRNKIIEHLFGPNLHVEVRRQLAGHSVVTRGHLLSFSAASRSSSGARTS